MSNNFGPLPINYVSRGDGQQLAIVLCPDICPHYLLLSRNVSSGESWVLRDYVGTQSFPEGRKIVRLNHLDVDDLNNIEGRVTQVLPSDQILPNAVVETQAWRNRLTQLSGHLINTGETRNIFDSYWGRL